MFLLDLALRYFVFFIYNLNGFMEPLRTGIVRGGFLCLGVVAGRSRSLGFARDDNFLRGMTICWRMTVFRHVDVFGRLMESEI